MVEAIIGGEDTQHLLSVKKLDFLHFDVVAMYKLWALTLAP